MNTKRNNFVPKTKSTIWSSFGQQRWVQGWSCDYGRGRRFWTILSQPLLKQECPPLQSNYIACSSAHVPVHLMPTKRWRQTEWARSRNKTVSNCAVHTAILPSKECSKHLYISPKVKNITNHHTYLTIPLNLTIYCCILQKLSHCWGWRLTATITDEEPSPEYDITHAKMLVFLAITVQICYSLHIKLTTGQQWTSFTHPSIGTQWNKTYLHILKLLHFTDNRNEDDGRGKNFDTLLKICNVFKILNMIFFKILQPFWTSSSRWCHCTLQRKSHFHTMYSQRTLNVSAYKYTNYTTPLVIFLKWNYLQKARQHMIQSQNWPIS